MPHINNYLIDILGGEKLPDGSWQFTDRRLVVALGRTVEEYLPAFRKLMRERATELGPVDEFLDPRWRVSPRGPAPKTVRLTLRQATKLAGWAKAPKSAEVMDYLARLGELVEEGEIATSNYDRAKVEEAREHARALHDEYKEDWGTSRKIGYGLPARPAKVKR